MSNEKELKIGDIVTGIYKTGKYIGEITQDRSSHYLVKVKAVLKHPQQGDLHHPKQAEVGFFHERRALAFNEQTNIPKTMVKKFEGEIPDYYSSLKLAIEHLMEELDKEDSVFGSMSKEKLKALKQDYFKGRE
ncbi:kinase-associated lipoprotein B [Bacillus songklensis]|uniref:Kinase-associated lipoprotein B n=1 Tax=Bacillus songklensis TaxID=1069116 RepID=A0ABV8B8Q7_9BACI